MMRSILAIIKKSKNKIRIVFRIALAAYLVYLVYLTFFDHIYGRAFFHRRVNLIPFRTIDWYIMNSNNRKIMLINIVGNIVAFMPMGFLLPLVSERMIKWSKVMMTALLATLTIEIVQYAFGVGVTDIDDVILNMAGAGAGYLLSMILLGVYFRVQKSFGSECHVD